MSEVKYLATDYGASLAYRKTPGRNPGVVFLTGFMSNMEGSKATYLEDFVSQRGNSFLRFDYRGHGQSSDRFEQGTISDWALDAITAIDKLTDGPQVLVGSSMGGWIMLLTALRRPQQIAGLMGLASAPDFTRILQKHYLNDTQREQLRLEGSIQVPCDYDGSPYVITRKLLADGDDNCLLEHPITLDIPVRLVHGMEDKDVAWQTSLQLCEHLSSNDVETLFIKNGDHRLSTETDLERICQTLDQLLKQIEED